MCTSLFYLRELLANNTFWDLRSHESIERLRVLVAEGGKNIVSNKSRFLARLLKVRQLVKYCLSLITAFLFFSGAVNVI
jgi:hypothetical protein